MPMMILYLPFLLLGNLVIGLLEGYLLSKFFELTRRRAIFLMIGANYVSMGVGLVLFGYTPETGLLHSHWPQTILNYQTWIFAAVSIAFVVALILEWPFYHASFEKDKRPLRRTIPACLFVQMLSYLCCLTPISWVCWEIDLGQVVSIENSPSFVPDDQQFWVYYIDTADGDIHRMRPNGSGDERFMEGEYGKNDKLAIYRKSPNDVPKYDLYVTRIFPEVPTTIVESFAAPESTFNNKSVPILPARLLSEGYYAADLRSDKTAEWRVLAGSLRGFHFTRLGESGDEYSGDAKESFHLQLSTAFGIWQGHNPSILPGEIVIFEFGGQICALDLNTRKLALIRMGSGPVVVRDEDETSD